MKVSCDVSHTERENERGGPVDGVTTTCSRCQNEQFSFGTSSRSVNRSLALLNEECPRDENNFYEVQR